MEYLPGLRGLKGKTRLKEARMVFAFVNELERPAGTSPRI
jgi:hypothetical protein